MTSETHAYFLRFNQFHSKTDFLRAIPLLALKTGDRIVCKVHDANDSTTQKTQVYVLTKFEECFKRLSPGQNPVLSYRLCGHLFNQPETANTPVDILDDFGQIDEVVHYNDPQPISNVISPGDQILIETNIGSAEKLVRFYTTLHFGEWSPCNTEEIAGFDSAKKLIEYLITHKELLGPPFKPRYAEVELACLNVNLEAEHRGSSIEPFIKEMHDSCDINTLSNLISRWRLVTKQCVSQGSSSTDRKENKSSADTDSV